MTSLTLVSNKDKQEELALRKSRVSYADCLSFLRVTDNVSDYHSVDMLLRHLGRKTGSHSTFRYYLMRLYNFCLSTNMDPDMLISMPKDMIEKLLQDYADSYNDSKHSLVYINNNVLAPLRSFFKRNGFKGVMELDVEGYYVPPRYRKIPEYIPTKYEVYLIADSACSLRDRAAILTLYSTGLRNSSLRAECYRDVKEELRKNIDNILVPVYPEMKLIDPNACKGNIPYFTFTCDEATLATKLYLKEKELKYGKIDDNEPLFSSEYNQIEKKKRSNKILSSRQLQLVVKEAAKRALGFEKGEQVTPHCLRKAFESVLHSELLEGGRLDSKIQDFFMGHVLAGARDPYFDKSKIEELRMEYSKLSFGRVIVDNKFKVLRGAVMKAFQGTGVDPDRVMEEYVEMMRSFRNAKNE